MVASWVDVAIGLQLCGMRGVGDAGAATEDRVPKDETTSEGLRGTATPAIELAPEVELDPLQRALET